MTQGVSISEQSEDIVHANCSPELLARRLLSGLFRMEDDGLYKRCSRCKDYWPADSEFFYSNHGTPDGLNPWCKACYLENRYPEGRTIKEKAYRLKLNAILELPALENRP